MYENELYHHGVKGMKWGQRKKYQSSNGGLNSLGKARKSYEAAKTNQKQAKKTFRKNRGSGIGVEGIAKYQKAQTAYNKASMNTLSAKAKYNAAKTKTKTKADKAEFNTYRKAMQRTGLPGSVYDVQSGGQSTLIYNKVKAEKGKAYADKVSKKVQNRAYAQLAASTAVSVGSMAVATYLEYKR